MKLSVSKLACVLVLIIAGGLGCGPTRVSSAIRDADLWLEVARAHNAQTLAPYEYAAASSYLHKARQERGCGAYEAGIDYANKALKFAKEAQRKSVAINIEGTPANAH